MLIRRYAGCSGEGGEMGGMGVSRGIGGRVEELADRCALVAVVHAVHRWRASAHRRGMQGEERSREDVQVAESGRRRSMQSPARLRRGVDRAVPACSNREPLKSPALPPARGSQPSTRSAPSEGSIASPSLTQSTHLSPQWQTRSLPTTSPSWPLIVTVCHRTCPHIPMDQHMQYVPRKVSTSRFYTQVHRPNPLPVIRRHGSTHVIPLDHNQSATEPQNENPNRQHDRPSGP